MPSMQYPFDRLDGGRASSSVHAYPALGDSPEETGSGVPGFTNTMNDKDLDLPFQLLHADRPPPATSQKASLASAGHMREGATSTRAGSRSAETVEDAATHSSATDGDNSRYPPEQMLRTLNLQRGGGGRGGGGVGRVGEMGLDTTLFRIPGFGNCGDMQSAARQIGIQPLRLGVIERKWEQLRSAQGEKESAALLKECSNQMLLDLLLHSGEGSKRKKKREKVGKDEKEKKNCKKKKKKRTKGKRAEDETEKNQSPKADTHLETHVASAAPAERKCDETTDASTVPATRAAAVATGVPDDTGDEEKGEQASHEQTNQETALMAEKASFLSSQVLDVGESEDVNQELESALDELSTAAEEGSSARFSPCRRRPNPYNKALVPGGEWRQTNNETIADVERWMAEVVEQRRQLLRARHESVRRQRVELRREAEVAVAQHHRSEAKKVAEAAAAAAVARAVSPPAPALTHPTRQRPRVAVDRKSPSRRSLQTTDETGDDGERGEGSATGSETAGKEIGTSLLMEKAEGATLDPASSIAITLKIGMAACTTVPFVRALRRQR